RKGGTVPAPFQPWFIQLAGLGELRQVAACEPAGAPLGLQGGALFSGLYLNELLVRLLPRELPQPELFVAYAGAVGELAELAPDDAAGLEPVLRRFERQLLEAMGQAVNSSHQADTHEPLRGGAWYQYYPEHGWLPAREGQRGAWSGADILAVGEDDFSSPGRRRLAKLLYRLALEPLLGGKPLKSRDLFAALAPRQTPAAAAAPEDEESSA
ncbi:MAG: DNA repair protein RecO C-terminal domain-containing protein, partial [Perlucidibaca sp.]